MKLRNNNYSFCYCKVLVLYNVVFVGYYSVCKFVLDLDIVFFVIRGRVWKSKVCCIWELILFFGLDYWDWEWVWDLGKIIGWEMRFGLNLGFMLYIFLWGINIFFFFFLESKDEFIFFLSWGLFEMWY